MTDIYALFNIHLEKSATQSKWVGAKIKMSKLIKYLLYRFKFEMDSNIKEHLLLMMSHSTGAGINMSKLIEPLSGFLRKKEATTWTGIRIHHSPPNEKYKKNKNI